MAIFFASCTKDDVVVNSNVPVLTSPGNDGPFLARNFPETFDAGVKTDYVVADVALPTGIWNLNDAILGGNTADAKYGTKSVRIENTGTLTMQFDISNGARSISLYYARYGEEANSTFKVLASVNSGSSWVQLGSDITASSSTLTKAIFYTSFTGNVRFQVQKTGGGILNIDYIDIQENATTVIDEHLTMGNPSNAVINNSYPNNYLMVKHQYALSYNDSKGEANWVSWHVSPEWNGTAPRCDCFLPDDALPAGFYSVFTGDYGSTGFDRGHMCPSADRSSNTADNAATFLMTNMQPQAPNLNQITWANLEDYCRTLLNNGNELYIISGGYGSGGTGTSGGVTNSISYGRINVPARFWKVIVILPQGTNDISRVTTSTRVIAVNMPNIQTVNSQPWGNYRVSVVSLENLLGYNFLSNVPPAIQAVIEATADTGPTS